MHKLLGIDLRGEVEEVGVEHLAFFVNADVERGLAGIFVEHVFDLQG